MKDGTWTESRVPRSIDKRNSRRSRSGSPEKRLGITNRRHMNTSKKRKRLRSQNMLHLNMAILDMASHTTDTMTININRMGTKRTPTFSRKRVIIMTTTD